MAAVLASASGTKTKLTISPCTIDDAGNITVDSSKPAFEAMINPSGYTHNRTIQYNTQKTMGQAGAEPKFSAVCPEKIKLEKMIIDGTGVAATVVAGVSDVKSRIARLMEVAYNYVGTKHEPNHVRLLWGSLIFFGRVESISVEYTMFKPSGEPLRAKVDLSFVGWMSTDEISLAANRSSPDLTHIVEVKAGDTLPMLCYRIYKDSAYYMDVARVNGLTNFRELRPGSKLIFPPLA